MHILKKYPNRRLYDTEKSVYVTLEDVRRMILAKDPVKVLDSKTGKDLTRSVLLQIIAEQEAEGHEPLLTNKVLEQVVRFYGDSMQGVLGRYLEQSIMTFYRNMANQLAQSATEAGARASERREERSQALESLTYEAALRDKVVVGTPKMVTERLMQLREELGLAGILAELNCGGQVPLPGVMRSLDLMCNEVMPHFK